jgi:hypothetical protein
MTEQEKFNQTMKKVLSISKQELQRRIEADRKERVCSKTHSSKKNIPFTNVEKISRI